MNLKGNPFYLNDEQIAWVEDNLAQMSVEEKTAQLFCVNARGGDTEEFERIVSCYGGMPGGIMYRPLPVDKAVAFTNKVMDAAKIPVLIAANLEKGGNGIVQEGTTFGSPMEVAATDDVGMADRLARLCAEEAVAVGANWAFAPIIDIDYEYHNPITNTRTFGSDVDRVAQMGKKFTEVVQNLGMAATIKHFPGDGTDERDQHLVTSVNHMSCEEWDRTYGKVYKECIDAGALTCMVGHIMQPAYTRKINPEIREEDILPGSLSRELMTGLLREQLGFNGLIVTDATTMAGYTIPMSRRLAVPTSIAAGADMFLFSKNAQEDLQFMQEGIASGIVTQERLNEAVTRILAVKAALGLHKECHKPDLERARKIVGSDDHRAWARECADKAITLVKEEKGVLPLKPGGRVLYIPIESDAGFQYSARAGVCADVCRRLQEEGLVVDVFNPGDGEEGKLKPTTTVIGQYEYIIYLANMVTKSNQTVVRIEWAQPMGANCPHYVQDIPTIFISVENPYHLLDVPRIKTFINCYNSNDTVLDALIEKLMGRSEFKGISPIDPYCGKWDTRL